MMDEISELIGQLANDEGFNTTSISVVRIFKAKEYQNKNKLNFL